MILNKRKPQLFMTIKKKKELYFKINIMELLVIVTLSYDMLSINVCDQQSNLDRPLFLVIIPLLLLAPVVKIPEGVVIGFQIFAWAPN